MPAINCRRCGAGLLEPAAPRILVLLATIPARRASCERLLQELTRQSRVPDGVILCLDGYGDAPAPACPKVLPVADVFRTAAPSGPGQRWRVVREMMATGPLPPLDLDCLAPEDILICLDDDAELSGAPRFIEALVDAVERDWASEVWAQDNTLFVGADRGSAAAAMGHTPYGHRAAPGDTSRGRLILGCGCGLALRARHLEGLEAFAAEVLAAGGPDALGPCGDDQALVSAHLWRKGVPILHAATGPLSFFPGTQRDSQTRARKERGEDLQAQARAIARITGWPLPEPVVEVERREVLSWEEELEAVPVGAVRARTGLPPAGHRRVLVVDGEEPERNGVYDVPR